MTKKLKIEGGQLSPSQEKALASLLEISEKILKDLRQANQDISQH